MQEQNYAYVQLRNPIKIIFLLRRGEFSNLAFFTETKPSRKKKDRLLV